MEINGKMKQYNIQSADPVTVGYVGRHLYRAYPGPIGPHLNIEKGKRVTQVFDGIKLTYMFFDGIPCPGTQLFNISTGAKLRKEAERRVQDFKVEPIHVKISDFNKAIEQVNAALSGR